MCGIVASYKLKSICDTSVKIFAHLFYYSSSNYRIRVMILGTIKQTPSCASAPMYQRSKRVSSREYPSDVERFPKCNIWQCTFHRTTSLCVKFGLYVHGQRPDGRLFRNILAQSIAKILHVCLDSQSVLHTC